MSEIIISLVVILVVIYLISRKHNAIIALAIGGLVLLFAAVITGHPILSAKETTGIIWLDPFKAIELAFLSRLGNIGLTIMVLFGYSSYMTLIGASEVTINIMTRPLAKIKSQYILIPAVFLLGNLLSLVVPSASSLAVLLMATLFPILTRVDMSPLTAAAIIATSATIMPTPLGADNIIAANTFNINIMDYVIAHGKISLPTLILMAIAHYFWQSFMDRKDSVNPEIDVHKIARINTNLPPAYYAILPVLPLILVLLFSLVLKSLKLNIGLVTITFISLFISVMVESIRQRDFTKITHDIQEFFKGMGNGLAMVVSLLVAASLVVEGLKALGVIDMLIGSVTGISGAGILMMLVFSGMTFLIGLISGVGLSVFYATIGMIPAIADAVAIPGPMITLPMQMIANLVRSISPVAACIMIICSTMGATPIQLIKRTSVPVITGCIVSLILAVLVIHSCDDSA